MSNTRIQHSIHDLPPLERGGVEARQGFDVQDHVAAGLFISMIELPELLALWCETHDDITLIWHAAAGEEVEFVQVKSHALNQLWSLALLCERDRKVTNPVGTSIFERSLSNDRATEPCRFRMVTCRPVQTDLTLLTLMSDAPDRINGTATIKALAEEIANRVNGFRSENGNGAKFWLEHLRWEVVHSVESVQSQNLIHLKKLIEKRDDYIFSDQLDELYSSILTKVRDAASADWGVDPAGKKLTRQCAIQWLDAQLKSRQNPAPATGGKQLDDKLRIAGVDPIEVESALDSRRYYISERLRPQYLSLTNIPLIEGEVAATLHALRARLDAGEFPDNGVDFHAKCLNALQELQRTLSTTCTVPLSFLIGCMYCIADRCTHRFRKAKV